MKLKNIEEKEYKKALELIWDGEYDSVMQAIKILQKAEKIFVDTGALSYLAEISSFRKSKRFEERHLYYKVFCEAYRVVVNRFESA